MPSKTADLCDSDIGARVCALQWQSWGLRRSFEGSIRTVQCDGDIGLIRRVLSEQGSGGVLVVDGGGSLRRALFGDAMAAMASRNGWSGVIVHGAVRDVAEIESMDLGVKALGVCPQRATLGEAGKVDGPLTFGATDFTPGQWLVADSDGVVVLPNAPPGGN
jgi:regulator of ribonuclease activity A